MQPWCHWQGNAKLAEHFQFLIMQCVRGVFDSCKMWIPGFRTQLLLHVPSFMRWLSHARFARLWITNTLHLETMLKSPWMDILRYLNQDSSDWRFVFCTCVCSLAIWLMQRRLLLASFMFFRLRCNWGYTCGARFRVQRERGTCLCASGCTCIPADRNILNCKKSRLANPSGKTSHTVLMWLYMHSGWNIQNFKNVDN